MALISLQEVTIAFSGPPVLDKLTLQLEPGERVALLGRNGAGKTTLMKIMAGQMEADSGSVTWQKGINVAHLPQEVPGKIEGTVFDIVMSGLGARGQLLSKYQHLSHQMHESHTPEMLRQLDALQSELDRTGAWDTNKEVELIISRLKLDPESVFEELSGGQKRRALLARALVLKPEILMLDEPTNHLDIDSINWLEEFLKNYSGTVFFVTHDRMFMTHLSTRILELDRGRMFSWACDYPTFLERKQMALDNENAWRQNFDKKLAEEEVWIRQGVRARRVRNEGRVKALERLREAKKAQRSVEGQVRMKAQESFISGRMVIKAIHLGFSYGNNCLIKDFSTQILRGDKIGMIGPNGSGKTTLLRLLLGRMAPQTGKVKLGTNLQIAYYDQLREQLDEEKTVMQNVCGESETVTINGKPRHIIGYLEQFLFSPDRVRTPIKVLSGGERNRLLLARLFTRPFNLLVMDEPTNDLDIETLELLEELLLDYSGTLLLVSHDRSFLNNVVTSTLVLEGEGQINEYPGGYDDWLSQRQPQAVAEKTEGKAARKSLKPAKPVKPAARKKLNFSEQRELERLPEKIGQMEREQSALFARVADIEFCQKNPRELVQSKLRMQALETEIREAYQRWEELERMKEGEGRTAD